MQQCKVLSLQHHLNACFLQQADLKVKQLASQHVLSMLEMPARRFLHLVGFIGCRCTCQSNMVYTASHACKASTSLARQTTNVCTVHWHEGSSVLIDTHVIEPHTSRQAGRQACGAGAHLSHGLEHLGGDSRGQHGDAAWVIVRMVPPPAAPHPVRQQDANLIATKGAPHPCITWSVSRCQKTMILLTVSVHTLICSEANRFEACCRLCVVMMLIPYWHANCMMLRVR